MPCDVRIRVDEIKWIHERVVTTYDLHNPGMGHPQGEMILKNILATASSSSDAYEQAAIVLNKLISVHVFEDGNKRTAWLAVVKLLSEYDEQPSPDRSEVARVLRHIARYSTAELATWLRSGEIDRSKLRS